MRTERKPLLALVALVALAGGACRQGMYDQAKYEPYEKSDLFPNGTSARPLPPGTVARGQLHADKVYFTGADASGAFQPMPMKVTRELLARGRQRYDIFCSPCHDRLGTGNGMIVQRGYRQAASYHQQRLYDQPDGYFFDVITRGFGQMPSYASQIPPADRWAIVAYVRALQLSQNAELGALPGDVRRVAEKALAPGPEPAGGAPAAAPGHPTAPTTDAGAAPGHGD